jgi:hypothetical protein
MRYRVTGGPFVEGILGPIEVEAESVKKATEKAIESIQFVPVDRLGDRQGGFSVLEITDDDRALAGAGKSLQALALAALVRCDHEVLPQGAKFDAAARRDRETVSYRVVGGGSIEVCARCGARRFRVIAEGGAVLSDKWELPKLLAQLVALLALAILVGCGGAPFGDGSSAFGDPGPSDVMVSADAGHAQSDAGHDAADPPDVHVAVDAGPADAPVTQDAAPDPDAGACYPTPTSYYSLVAPSCKESAVDGGYAAPLDFVLVFASGASCTSAETPAACLCDYSCACLMPLLWAEQAQQSERLDGAPPGLLCSGTLNGCTVDALGVVRVDCN